MNKMPGEEAQEQQRFSEAQQQLIECIGRFTGAAERNHSKWKDEDYQLEVRRYLGPAILSQLPEFALPPTDATDASTRFEELSDAGYQTANRLTLRNIRNSDGMKMKIHHNHLRTYGKSGFEVYTEQHDPFDDNDCLRELQVKRIITLNEGTKETMQRKYKLKLGNITQVYLNIMSDGYVFNSDMGVLLEYSWLVKQEGVWIPGFTIEYAQPGAAMPVPIMTPGQT